MAPSWRGFPLSRNLQLVVLVLCVCLQGLIEVYNCRNLMVDSYTQENDCWKRHLVMYVLIIPGMFRDTDTINHPMLYCWHDCYHFSESQNADFALCMLFKHTNFDIKDAPCLHMVHMLQPPKSRPTTESTQTTMVNDPKKRSSPLRLGKSCESTKWTTISSTKSRQEWPGGR